MNAPRTRVQRRPVHGVLLLDKPLGFSSNQALQKVKWLLRADKAGHTGTLDPLATGVLPLCFGAATKFSQQHLDAHKQYQAVLRLGQATTTGDAEGEVIQSASIPNCTQADLDSLSLAMTGPQTQVPPMYSALKKDGKPLYEYARDGIDVERAARVIEVFKLNLSFTQDEKAQPAIKIEASCSKGTYIRTLGEDIAKALGTVGHLRALRRTQTGDFLEAGCITLSDLEAMTEEQRMAMLHPVEALLPNHQPVMLNDEDAARFLSGLRRRTTLPDASEVVVYAQHPRRLLGTAHIAGGELVPVRLLNPIEIEHILTQATSACP